MARLIAWIRNQCAIPFFAKLAKNRGAAFAVLGFVATYFLASLHGILLWYCPVRTVTGIRCPGCGMSNAMVHLIHGNVLNALKEHLFAPVILIGLIFLLIVSCLPAKLHRNVVAHISTFEAETGIGPLIMLALLLYWIIRLISKC